MEYTIRRGFKRYKFDIGESFLKVSEHGLLGFEEYEIPFEHIGDRKVTGVYSSDSAFLVSFFSLAVSILLVLADSYKGFLLSGFICIVSFLYGIITRVGKVSIPLLTGSEISIVFKSSTRMEAVEFSDLLLTKVRAYVKSKYSKFDRNMPLEKQFENLDYLHDRNLVSSDEYEEIKNYLLGPGRRSIGFNN